MAGTQNAEHLIDKTRTDADKNAVCTFLIHAAMLAGVLFVLFGIIFGLSAVPDDSMEPVLSAGDLVFYYRLDRDFRRDDIVVYEANGEMRTGRIAAGPGDSVEVSEDNHLYINGSRILENDIFYETVRFDSDINYPVTLGDGEYFILCDHRDTGMDSRYFGAVDGTDIKGKLFAAIRREGF